MWPRGGSPGASGAWCGPSSLTPEDGEGGPGPTPPGLTGSGSWEGSRRQGVPNPRVLASPRCAAQGAGEEAGRRGDHRADGGWEAPGGAREEGAPV